MNERPKVEERKEKGQQKKFGAEKKDGESGKFKDFIPSVELKPEMKANGFIVDKFLSKVAHAIKNKGYDCKIVDAEPEALVAQAVKENRIFLCTNNKFFNKKVTIPRGLLHLKASPESKC
jgi:hypothetical protein